MEMLELTRASSGYGSKKIIKDISFSINRAEIFGIIGPNGSGKTTLMKMISGDIELMEGEVLLKKKPLSYYHSKEIAKMMAVLPQQTDMSFSYKVEEVVMLGRYPYQKGLFSLTSAEDKEVVCMAMKKTGVWEYRNKTLQSLSGGERQRVLLARALAQEPEILLLDEPTNHLDLSYQLNLLDSLKALVQERKLTVIAILHDLNLASLYCDRILLLENGKMTSLNRPFRTMGEEALRAVYEADIKRVDHPNIACPLITLMPASTPNHTEQSLKDILTIEQKEEMIKIASSVPLKTLSSAVLGAGFSWKELFVNRFVSKDYNSDDVEAEYKNYLLKQQIDEEETLGMMTAARLEDASFVEWSTGDISLLVVVTAGVSNAVDVSKAFEQKELFFTVGTINTWIFIKGELSEAAFVQGMMTATEAKVKAMAEEQVLDPISNTIATGTSTDSLMIAATQTGKKLTYAGSITPLGKAIGRAVFEATVSAIKKNKERRLQL